MWLSACTDWETSDGGNITGVWSISVKVKYRFSKSRLYVCVGVRVCVSVTVIFCCTVAEVYRHTLRPTLSLYLFVLVFLAWWGLWCVALNFFFSGFTASCRPNADANKPWTLYETSYDIFGHRHMKCRTGKEKLHLTCPWKRKILSFLHIFHHCIIL